MESAIGKNIGFQTKIASLENVITLSKTKPMLSGTDDGKILDKTSADLLKHSFKEVSSSTT